MRTAATAVVKQAHRCGSARHLSRFAAAARSGPFYHLSVVSRVIKSPACGAIRLHSTSPRSSDQAARVDDEEPARPLTDRADDASGTQRKAEIAARKAEEPSYQLTFTCAKCLDRSTHRISKQGYHHGTVLVNCPGCKNKHLISDHLGIFSDRSVTLEDIMKEKGQHLKKGVLGADGDVEFY